MQLFKRKPKGESRQPVADVSAAGSAMSSAMGPTPSYANRDVQPFSRAGDLTVGDYASGVPQIRVGAMIDVFRRQLPWMAAAILLGTAAAFYLTKDLKRTYTGEARVLVQLGSEYVYNPVAATAQSGLLLTPDHIVLNEVSIMTSEDVIRDVLGIVVTQAGGWSVFEPSMMGKTEEEKLRYFEKSFSAVPRAKSSIIDLAFKHPDPDVAVMAVNAFLEIYTKKRNIVFNADQVDTISERRAFAEQQLSRNEQLIAAELRRNDISDFDSERTGATARTEALKTELNALRASITETEASLTEVEDQLRATPETINLQVDDRASQRVAQAELELKQLLARYLPTSAPVQQKQVEIAELRALQTENGGRPVGGRRVGPNPVQQALETRRNTLQSTADAMREKEYVLQQQLNGADAKARRLRDLSPRFENLLRERDTLQTRLRGLNAKEQDALVAKAQAAQAQSENVRVIAEAEVARKGRNTRMIAFVIASALWGGTVFLLGLLRTFLDPRLYVRSASPVSSERVGGRRPQDRRGDFTGLPDTLIPEPVAPYIPSAPAPHAPPPPFVAPAAVAHTGEYVAEGQSFADGQYAVQSAGANPPGYYNAETVPLQAAVGGYDPVHGLDHEPAHGPVYNSAYTPPYNPYAAQMDTHPGTPYADTDTNMVAYPFMDALTDIVPDPGQTTAAPMAGIEAPVASSVPAMDDQGLAQDLGEGGLQPIFEATPAMDAAWRPNVVPGEASPAVPGDGSQPFTSPED